MKREPPITKRSDTLFPYTTLILTRMDYTIIGAEANLAARLQSIAEPGSIVISYETCALVQDLAQVRKLDPVHVKGINREVVPYVVEGEAVEAPAGVFNAYGNGMNVSIDKIGKPQCREKVCQDV